MYENTIIGCRTGLLNRGPLRGRADFHLRSVYLTRSSYAKSLLPIHLAAPSRLDPHSSLEFILGNSLNMAEVATEVKLFNKW